MNVVSIPLDLVDVGDRLRTVDEDYAQLIAASMRTDGQRTPVEVRAAGADGRYRIIAGGHRLRAAQIVGFAELQAVVLEVGDLQAQRLEIEENLIRFDLSELDRSTFLARWKEVYEALNEAVRHGGKRAKSPSRQNGDMLADRIDRFTTTASERLGLSERVIQRAVQRYTRIPPDLRTRIAGTWLADHGAELDFLARLKPDIQRQVVALMLERGATALKPLRDQVLGIREPAADPDQAQFDALMKAWGNAGAKARRRFEAELAKDRRFDLGTEAA